MTGRRKANKWQSKTNKCCVIRCNDDCLKAACCALKACSVSIITELLTGYNIMNLRTSQHLRELPLDQLDIELTAQHVVDADTCTDDSLTGSAFLRGKLMNYSWLAFSFLVRNFTWCMAIIRRLFTRWFYCFSFWPTEFWWSINLCSTDNNIHCLKYCRDSIVSFSWLCRIHKQLFILLHRAAL